MAAPGTQPADRRRWGRGHRGRCRSGGSGEGSNPEELFSAGYAACFLGALHATSKQAGTPAPDDSTVNVTIGIGKDPADGGFGLTATIDVTLPGTPLRLGGLHPISQTIQEFRDIMGRLGFSVADGPEIEDEYHNFEALNIPSDHPARDPLDNFYIAAAQASADGPRLLRSQTSTVQIRVMERTRPPVRVVSLGRVYRPDAVDATHSCMFHQMEGLMVDRGVTMADLKTVLRLFAQSYLGEDVRIRFRPSFFPFTEPSVEVDMQWHGGGGGRWVEMGGAGMVDPNLFEFVGYDPERYTGFAFGWGLERIAVLRHGIPDLRELWRNDPRLLRQF